MLYVADEYDAVSDATMSHSFISLRRIDEFLSEKKKMFQTDLRYGDLSIDKDIVLGRDGYVLTDSEKGAINRFEAHLTKFGQADVDDLEGLLFAIERTKEIRVRLEAELKRLIAEEL